MWNGSHSNDPMVENYQQTETSFISNKSYISLDSCTLISTSSWPLLPALKYTQLKLIPCVYLFVWKLQVFLFAKVFFSIGGQHFSSEPVHFSYMPDTIMDSARDVTIKLHHRIGRYIQVHLYFAMRWIMLSEISFISSKYVCCLFPALPCPACSSRWHSPRTHAPGDLSCSAVRNENWMNMISPGAAVVGVFIRSDAVNCAQWDE